MLSRSLLTTVLAASVAVVTLAQGGGGPATPLQEFADKLKLDPKTQLPAVQQMFGEAAKEAAPIAQEMVELRRQLVNLELTNRSAEAKPVLGTYANAAARMAGLETRVFQQVYATLKPAQQSKAAEAFALMAGFFQSSGGRGGRGSRGGGVE